MSLTRRAVRLLYGRRPWRGLVRRLRPRALVLLYHRVAEPVFDPFRLAVPPALFGTHMRALRTHFTAVSVEEMLDGLAGGRCLDGAVAVTLDDGYADSLYAAEPIAASLGVPLTVFVTAGPVMDGTPFWWDELVRAVAGLRDAPPVDVETTEGRTVRVGGREDLTASLRALRRDLMLAPPGDPVRERVMARLLRAAGGRTEEGDFGRPLTPSELVQLARRPQVTVGAHSLTHPSLRHLGEPEKLRELRGARVRLESLVGRRVGLLAYPFGGAQEVDQATVRAAERSGYRAAFTTTEALLTPDSVVSRPYGLPRVSVGRSSAEELVARLRWILEQG